MLLVARDVAKGRATVHTPSLRNVSKINLLLIFFFYLYQCYR